MEIGECEKFAQTPEEERGGVEQQEWGSLEASMFWELLAMFWKLLAKTSYSKTDQAERACSRSDLYRHDHNHNMCRVAILTFKCVVSGGVSVG